MQASLGENWPRKFAEWMQEVLVDVENGIGNAFSLLVHSETRRVLGAKLVLQPLTQSQLRLRGRPQLRLLAIEPTA